MANESNNPLIKSVSWAAEVGGAVGLLSLFVPISREFLESTGLLGWALFALLLVLFPVILRSMLRTAVRSIVPELRPMGALQNIGDSRVTEVREAESLKAARIADVKLVREWLQGWDLHGRFHVHLVEGVIFAHLPLWFVHELEERVVLWNRDPRELTQPILKSEWEAFREAATDFHDKISEYMWLDHLTSAEREAGFEQFMHIPPEWKTRDHERYQKALDELGDSRSNLEDRMSALLRTLHLASIDETTID